MRKTSPSLLGLLGKSPAPRDSDGLGVFSSRMAYPPCREGGAFRASPAFNFLTVLALLMASLGLPAIAEGRVAPSRKLPHFDLELSGAEFQAQLAQRFLWNQLNVQKSVHAADHPFHEIIRVGTRNLDWIKILNEQRAQKLSFSTPNNQQGYPISQPSIYNESIIEKNFERLKHDCPPALKEVLFGQQALPSQLPTEEELYLHWGLAIDRIYQLTLRWTSYMPYLDELKQESHRDLRGYHALQTSPALAHKLKNWNSISDHEKTMFVLWLNQICRNRFQSKALCQRQVDEAIRTNTTYDFYSKHKVASELIWKEMMDIPVDGRSRFLSWKTPSVAEIPFLDPMDQLLRSYFIDNIQQEWRFPPSLSIHLFFVNHNQEGVKVIWEPGVTPFVPSLGSNLIYMDANAPISEYDVQWTIRHEFGHILGFPDCYLEFFDEELGAIVGYQLDTSDLMCSRRGHLKSRHVSELKRVY